MTGMQDTLIVVVGQSPAVLAGSEARLDWLQTVLSELRGQDVDLLVLPELFLTGTTSAVSCATVPR